jgi:uncharacterized membrane protein
MSSASRNIVLSIAAILTLPLAANAATFTPLGPATANQPFRPRGISGDGSLIVGSQGNSPFIWSAAGGVVALATLGGPANGLARAISADGATVVGMDFGADQAFRWNASAEE